VNLYWIACQGEFPRTELLAAAKKIAATELARFEPNDFYLGFIGAHDGRNAAFVFVDFWGNEKELFHGVFLSAAISLPIFPRSLFGPIRLRLGPGTTIVRARSLDQNVLLKADAPDFSGYLSERMNSDL
jgi:hypothetical protein